MKKILLTLLAIIVLSPLGAQAAVSQVIQGGTGASTFGQGWINSSGGKTALTASTSPTVNYVTATSTTASSTLPLLKVTTAIDLLGNYITNLASYIRSLFSSSATGLTYTSSTGAFSLTSGYNIPLTASTTNWNTFYDTPSNRITAGTGLSWSGNTLNSSGGGVTSFAQTYGASQTGAITIATSTTAINNDWGITNSGGTFTFNLPTATASIRGLLSSTDWSTFNGKQAAISTIFPLSLSAGTLAWNGIATTSNPTAGNLFYSNGTTGLVPVATTTLSFGTGFSTSGNGGFLVGGSNQTINFATIANGSVLGNVSGITAIPGAVATTSLFTWTGTGDSVRAASPTFTGTVTLANLLATSSSTLQNFTGVNATTSQATTTNFTVSGKHIILNNTLDPAYITGTTSPSFGIASSTLDALGKNISVATSTFLLKNFPQAFTMNGFYCVASTTGTAIVNFSHDNGNKTEAAVVTTGTFTRTVTNNTWTAFENFNMQASSTSPTTPVNRITCTVVGKFTSD